MLGEHVKIILSHRQDGSKSTNKKRAVDARYKDMALFQETHSKIQAWYSYVS